MVSGPSGKPLANILPVSTLAGPEDLVTISLATLKKPVCLATLEKPVYLGDVLNKQTLGVTTVVSQDRA